jgi:hypothetical protein
VTDLLLRKAQTVRAGAQGDEDYDVVGPDGIVIGRIFEATTSPGVGTPWMWILAYGHHEDRTPTHGYVGRFMSEHQHPAREATMARPVHQTQWAAQFAVASIDKLKRAS